MLPPVELTNMATYNSNSMDSSLLDLLNTSSHVYDFKIPLKCFRSPIVVDLVAATWFYQFLIVDLLIQQMLVELKGTESLRSHKSNSQNFQEPLKRS